MNLFHQLIYKELNIVINEPFAPFSSSSIFQVETVNYPTQNTQKIRSNPIYFHLYSFLSGPPHNRDFIETKFYSLNLILANPFITKEQKNELLEIFCKLQRQYHIFARLANRWKKYKAIIQVDYDMCLNPIDRKKTPHTIIYQNNAGYIFRIADLINIVNSALLNCPQFFVDPLFPKNPYTNVPFTYAMLFHIYTSIRKSDFKMPILIQLFYDADFDMKRFVYENESIIRDMYIKDFVKNSPHNILRKYIIEMIYRIDTGRYLRISKDFPTELLVNIMRPYLYLNLINIYSLTHSDKKYCSLYKLKRKMAEFIEYNPMFGRKKCIPYNGGYKVVYNINHVPFTINDAYDYENQIELESNNYSDTESENNNDSDTELERSFS